MPARKKWTVMVWIAGDNDLEEFGAKDLKEMQSVGSNADLSIVAQFDRMSDHHTRRFEIRAGRSKQVADLGETNTGNPAVAADFFAWGIENYPADRLLAVIWNHGSGIDETDIYKSVRASGGQVSHKGEENSVSARLVRQVLGSPLRRSLFASTPQEAILAKGIAYDDTSKDFLDNAELRRVLDRVKTRTGRCVDVLGCDACLMSMLEIAYQLKDHASVMVGSEETEPGEGWPYDRVLKALAEKPGMDARALGKTIVEAYGASYRGSGEAVTLSALDLTRALQVGELVSVLAKALVKGLGTAAEFGRITAAVNAAQRYYIPDFVDLGDLCAQLAATCKSAAVRDAATALKTGLKKSGFVIANLKQGASVKKSTGVSILVPVRAGKVSVTYSALEFAIKHDWDEFLAAWCKKSGLAAPRAATSARVDSAKGTAIVLPFHPE